MNIRIQKYPETQLPRASSTRQHFEKLSIEKGVLKRFQLEGRRLRQKKVPAVTLLFGIGIESCFSLCLSCSRNAKIFLMAYIRARLKQYHLGILILIISSQLVTLISSNTSTTSPPEATKCAEILSKKLTEAVTTTRQRKQNFSTLEISPTSSSATVMSPSVAVKNRRNTNETYLRKHGCSREQKDDCPRYVDKYSSFYLKVGMKNNFKLESVVILAPQWYIMKLTACLELLFNTKEVSRRQLNLACL